MTVCLASGVGSRRCMNLPKPPSLTMPLKKRSDSARAKLSGVTSDRPIGGRRLGAAKRAQRQRHEQGAGRETERVHSCDGRRVRSRRLESTIALAGRRLTVGIWAISGNRLVDANNARRSSVETVAQTFRYASLAPAKRRLAPRGATARSLGRRRDDDCRRGAGGGRLGLDRLARHQRHKAGFAGDRQRRQGRHRRHRLSSQRRRAVAEDGLDPLGRHRHLGDRQSLLHATSSARSRPNAPGSA